MGRKPRTCQISPSEMKGALFLFYYYFLKAAFILIFKLLFKFSSLPHPYTAQHVGA